LKKEDYKKIINQIKKETKNNNLSGDKKIADSIISDIKNNREHFGKFISNCKKNWTRGDMDDKEERDLHLKCLKGCLIVFHSKVFI
jgi:ferredoxin-thioredoxin reductase catalytic subunit